MLIIFSIDITYVFYITLQLTFNSKLSPVDRDLGYLEGLQYSKVYGAVQMSPVDG